MKLSLMCGTDATADPDPNEDEQESTDTDTQSLSSSDEETQPQLNSTSVPNEDTKESTESDTESYSNTSDTHEQSASEGEETERSMEVIYAYKYIPKDYDITNNTIEKVSKSLQSSTTVIISDCIDISEPKIHELSISIDKQTLYLAVGIIPVSSINDGLETYQLHKDKQAYFKIIDKTEQIEEIELTLDTVQLSLAISMLRDDEFGNEYDNKYICKPGCVNRDRYHWALCIYGQNDVCSIQSMENYMTWNHILYVIKEGSYNNLYKQLQNILDENEIEYDEKPEDTARDINGALLDTLNEEEYQYLQRLIGIEHDDASVSSVNEDFDEEEKQEELQEDSMYQNKDIEEEIIPKTENIKRKHELIIIGYLRANTDNLHMFRARIMDRIFMFYHIKPYEYYYLEQDYDINPDANTIRKITSKSTTIIIGDCIESEFKKMHKLTIDIDGLQATSYMLIGITPKESLSKLQTHQLLLEKHTLRITGFEDISKVMLTFDASELSLSASLFDRYSNENTLKVIAREGSIEMMNYYWAICMYGKDDFCMVERVEIIASWEHLLHGIKQELYPELCTQIEEILDEDENEIKYDDIRTDITNRVFNMIDIKHTLTEDQVEYLRGLAVKTNQFRPITTVKGHINHRVKEELEDSIRRFRYRSDGDKNGLFFYFATKGTLNETNYAPNHIYSTDNLYVSTTKYGKTFMTIQLNRFSMRLTYLTLSKYEPSRLNVQASTDGKQWDTINLKIHSTKENMITFKNLNYDECSQYYCYFKLVEANYIKARKDSNMECELYGETQGNGIIVWNISKQKYRGLSSDILQDIYDVHRAFKFHHYHMMDYTPDQFKKDLYKNNNALQPAVRNRFNFKPIYVTNDDIFEVMSFIFLISLFVNQNKERFLAPNDFNEVRILIASKSVQSVFDRYITFPCTINDIGSYLENELGLLTNAYDSNICSIEDIISHNDDLTGFNANLLVIIDRKNDKVFTAKYKNINHDFKDLYANYFVGMTFKSIQNKSISAYLHYGIHEMLRFYPEQLTSIVPKLFVKSSMDGYEYAMALYSEEYRHGFCLGLNDKTFNTFYKQCTGVTHIHVNYNRDYVPVQLLDYEDEPEDVTNAIHFDERYYQTSSEPEETKEVDNEKQTQNKESKIRGLGARDGQIMSKWKSAKDIQSKSRQQTIPKQDHIETQSQTISKQSHEPAKPKEKASRDRKFLSKRTKRTKRTRYTHHTKNSRKGQCTTKDPKSFKECPKIQHIIISLLKYRSNNYRIRHTVKYEQCVFKPNDWDLNYLQLCYDHLIKVHRFCMDLEERKKLQKFVMDILGPCGCGEFCLVTNKHSMRKRELSLRNKSDDHDEASSNSAVSNHSNHKTEILLAILNSLHSYLNHTDGVLHRLKNQEFDGSQRFSTEEIGIDQDRVVELQKSYIEDTHRLLMGMGMDQQKLELVYEWWIDEQFDSDAFLDDLDDNEDPESNLYQLLTDLEQNQYYNPIYDNATKVDEHKELNSINFGISVLEWFNPYINPNDKPTFRNFKDEIINNPNSTLNERLYDGYKQQALLKVLSAAEAGEYWTLNEMMSLKIYTDTTKLQSIFRKSFWSKENDDKQSKRDFYWWAINVYRTALYHSMPIPRRGGYGKNCNKPKFIYHGLNDVLIIDSQLPIYNGPISTTVTNTIAEEFCDQKGLLWTIKPSYNNHFKFIIGMEMGWISCFKREAEVLLVNQYLPIGDTISYAKEENRVDQLLHQLKKWQTRITNPDVWFNRNLGFQLEEDWLDSIIVHPLLFEKSLFDDYLVLDRLVLELEFGKDNGFQKLYYLILSRQFTDNLILEDNQQIIKFNYDSNMDLNSLQIDYILEQEYLIMNSDAQYIHKPFDHYLYEFDSVDNIRFIVPICVNNTDPTWSIYVKTHKKVEDVEETFNGEDIEEKATEKLDPEAVVNTQQNQKGQRNNYIRVKQFEIAPRYQKIPNNKRQKLLQINYLLDLLQHYPQRIVNSVQLYNRINIHIQDEIAELILNNAHLKAKVYEHTYLGKHKPILKRLMDELNLKNELEPEWHRYRAEMVVKQLMHYQYLTYREEFEVTFDQSLVDALASHPHLFQVSPYENQRIISRLIRELCINDLKPITKLIPICNKILRDNFITNLELNENQQIITLRNTSQLDEVQIQIILSSQFLILNDDALQTKIDTTTSGDYVYEYDDIKAFRIIVPFHTDSNNDENKWSVYLKVEELNNCVKIQEFVIDSTTVNESKSDDEDIEKYQVQYLVNLLRDFDQDIENIPGFPNRLNQLHLKYLLYHPMLFKTSSYQQRSILQRLGEELTLTGLDQFEALSKEINTLMYMVKLDNIRCTQFIDNLELHENQQIIALRNASELNEQQIATILSGQYLIINDTIQHIYFDQIAHKKYVYKYDDINNVRLIIPFHENSNKWSVYFKALGMNNCIKVKEFMTDSLDKKDEVEYLLSVLHDFDREIEVMDEFSRKIEVGITEECIDIIKSHSMLFEESCHENRTILQRLMYELSIPNLNNFEKLIRIQDQISKDEFVTNLTVNAYHQIIELENIEHLQQENIECLLSYQYIVISDQVSHLNQIPSDQHYIYEFDDINDFKLIIPFNVTHNKIWSVYAKLKSKDNCIKVKQFEINTFDQDIMDESQEKENQTQYLLNLLLDYEESIQNLSTFYKQIGFKLDKDHVDIIKTLYFPRLSEKTCFGEEYPIINRLMKEFRLTNEFMEIWRIYTVRFDNIDNDSTFGYSIYKVIIDDDIKQDDDEKQTDILSEWKFKLSGYNDDYIIKTVTDGVIILRHQNCKSTIYSLSAATTNGSQFMDIPLQIICNISEENATDFATKLRLENNVVIRLPVDKRIYKAQSVIKSAKFLVRSYSKAGETEFAPQIEAKDVADNDALIYTFDNVDDIHFIVPYHDSFCKMNIYVQPKPDSNYVKLKSCDIYHIISITSNEETYKYSHLKKYLTKYQYQINDPNIFSKRINIDINKLDLSMIVSSFDNIITLKKQEIQLLTRLTEELRLKPLKALNSKYRVSKGDHTYFYNSIKMNIGYSESLSLCKYSLRPTIIRDQTIEYDHNQEIIIPHTYNAGKYEIKLKNEQLFADENWRTIQRIKLKENDGINFATKLQLIRGDAISLIQLNISSNRRISRVSDELETEVSDSETLNNDSQPDLIKNAKFLLKSAKRSATFDAQIASTDVENTDALIYEFSNEQEVCFIVPFSQVQRSIGIYVKPNSNALNYGLLKNFTVREKENCVAFFLACLESYHFRIVEPEIFYKRIGYRLGTEYIPRIVETLYPRKFNDEEQFLNRKLMAGDKKIFDRLVQELEIHVLNGVAPDIEFEEVNMNGNYFCATIQMKQRKDSKGLQQCGYKIKDSQQSMHKKSEFERFEYKYNDEIHIPYRDIYFPESARTFQILMANAILFGDNNHRQIQRITLIKQDNICDYLKLSGNIIRYKDKYRFKTGGIWYDVEYYKRIGGYVKANQVNNVKGFPKTIYLDEDQMDHVIRKKVIVSKAKFILMMGPRSKVFDIQIDAKTVSNYDQYRFYYSKDAEFIVPYSSHDRHIAIYVLPNSSFKHYVLIYTTRLPKVTDSKIKYFISCLREYRSSIINGRKFLKQTGTNLNINLSDDEKSTDESSDIPYIVKELYPTTKIYENRFGKIYNKFGQDAKESVIIDKLYEKDSGFVYKLYQKKESDSVWTLYENISEIEAILNEVQANTSLDNFFQIKADRMETMVMRTPDKSKFPIPKGEGKRLVIRMSKELGCHIFDAINPDIRYSLVKDPFTAPFFATIQLSTSFWNGCNYKITNGTDDAKNQKLHYGKIYRSNDKVYINWNQQYIVSMQSKILFYDKQYRVFQKLHFKKKKTENSFADGLKLKHDAIIQFDADIKSMINVKNAKFVLIAKNDTDFRMEINENMIGSAQYEFNTTDDVEFILPHNYKHQQFAIYILPNSSFQNYVFLKAFDVVMTQNKAEYITTCLRHCKSIITDKQKFIKQIQVIQIVNIDDANQFLIGMGMDEKKVETLNDWWQDEEFDSDSLLDDLEDNENHSNFYQFLNEMNQKEYYNWISYNKAEVEHNPAKFDQNIWDSFNRCIETNNSGKATDHEQNAMELGMNMRVRFNARHSISQESNKHDVTQAIKLVSQYDVDTMNATKIAANLAEKLIQMKQTQFITKIGSFDGEMKEIKFYVDIKFEGAKFDPLKLVSNIEKIDPLIYEFENFNDVQFIIPYNRERIRMGVFVKLNVKSKYYIFVKAFDIEKHFFADREAEIDYALISLKQIKFKMQQDIFYKRIGIKRMSSKDVDLITSRIDTNDDTYKILQSWGVFDT